MLRNTQNRSAPRRALIALAALALAAIGTRPASAQNLQELYNAARAYDANYLAAKALAESTQYRAEQTKALNRPSVSASVSLERSTSDTPTLDVKTRSSVAALTISQSLFDRVNDATIAQAQRSLDSSAADLQAAEQGLIVRLATAYFDVLAAQDTLAAARQNKTAIAEQLASAKRTFEVGTATVTDTREAQARFDLATAQEISASNDLQTKRVALDVLAGTTGVMPVELAPSAKFPVLERVGVDDWVSSSETGPSVRKAAAAYEVAKIETEKARAAGLPTISVSASVSGGYSKNRYAAGSLNGNANTSNVAITMQVPLFAGFSIQNRLKETLALEDQARYLLSATRRVAAQATLQLFYGVQSLRSQVGALEAAAASSQLALDSTQVGYVAGMRVNLDVLNAQAQVFTVRRDLARARYDLVIAGLKLQQAAGTLQPADVGAVNALIVR